MVYVETKQSSIARWWTSKRLHASIIGIVLWCTLSVKRLAAGMFLIVTLIFILPAVLLSFGLPSPTAAAFEAPLILGVAVLGYQLWKESDPEQIRRRSRPPMREYTPLRSLHLQEERSGFSRRMEQSSPNDHRLSSNGERSKERWDENAAVTESGTVRTNDIETYYVRRGDGPPIVFIHDMAMSANEWRPQMEALSNEYTTVAYDVRGHGHTGGSDRKLYTMELYAADLNAFLTELDIENPVLCGLSMGGCIAQMYAATYPEKVAGLVVSDAFTVAPLPLTGRLIFANLRFFGLLDRFVRYTMLNRFQTWVGNRLSPGVAGDGMTTQQLMEEAPTISHTEFVKIANSMARFSKKRLDASQITAPTLVMHGENLPAVLQDMHRRLAEELTNADVESTVIPDAGHASNIDNPAFFSTVVREFLSRIAPKPRQQ